MTRGAMGLVTLCVAIALAAGVASAAGVFARGDGSTAEAVSIRGERYEYATTGIYAYNAERVVAEGVGWDVVTLLLAVPALIAAAVGIARGSLRARLAAAGVLAYLFYQYLMYAVFWALGPLFPLFIALYAASAVAIVWLVATIDVTGLPERFDERFPAKAMSAFAAAIAILLVVMWTGRIATGLSGDVAEAGLLGTQTLAVQALDLGIIVPLAVATAVFAWRRSPWGYLLSSALAVKGLTMAGAICAMLVSAALVEGSLEVVPFTIFGAAAVGAGYLAWRILGAVRVETA